MHYENYILVIINFKSLVEKYLPMVSVSVRASLINWLAMSLGIHNIQIVILLKSHLLLVMILYRWTEEYI